VDFVWWRGSRAVAIEAKASRQYRREFRKGLDAFNVRGRPSRYVVYLGDRELRDDNVHVLPLAVFLRRLHEAEIIE
jgi:hypothetical protein